MNSKASSSMMGKDHRRGYGSTISLVIKRMLGEPEGKSKISHVIPVSKDLEDKGCRK